MKRKASVTETSPPSAKRLRTLSDEKAADKKRDCPERKESHKLASDAKKGNPYCSSEDCHCTDEMKAFQRGLRKHGVPLLTRQEVSDITASGVKKLGSGAYGSATLARDPRTQEELVIKTFFPFRWKDLPTEAINLKKL